MDKDSVRCMTRAELIAASEGMFGSRWGRPLARLLGIDPKGIRMWKRGERRIPDWAAAKIRLHSEVGPIGAIVRRSIIEMVPAVDAWDAHQVARRVVAELTNSGLVPAPGLVAAAKTFSLRPKRTPRVLLGRRDQTHSS